MKALLTCLDFPPAIGGIQTMLASLVAELRDWDLTVAAPDAPGAAAFDAGKPYRVVRLKGIGPGEGPRRFLPAFAALTPALALTRRPDVMLCGHPTLSLLGPAVRRLTGVPYLVFAYAKELRSPRLRPYLSKPFAQADRIVTISRYTTQEVEAIGVPGERIRQLPLGFGPGRFDGVTPSDLPRDLGLAGRPWLLTVSRLDEHYKGIDTVLRALPLIAARVPEARYVVAGDGGLRAYLERLADRLGCGERVHFLGRVSEADLAALYTHCTAFVLMSRDRDIDGGAEGFGLVLVEANSFGKPVLGGDSGGIPDAVVDGTTGLLADPESLISVAESSVGLLTNAALAARLGQQGQERALRDLTWAASARRLREIVEEALGKMS